MANLRIVSITVQDSTTILARFSEALNEEISVPNIVITSQTTGAGNPEVLSATVNGAFLTIITQPLVPYAAYNITFKSTDEVVFNSLNGDAIIPNYAVGNTQLIIAPPPSDDPVINYLTQFFTNNVYDTTAPSFISSYINGLASVISTCLYSIRQSGNENYLSYTVVDEPHMRGQGPFDRLNEESAYEVLRVGLTPTGAIATNLTQIASFPSYPVSLLATPYSDRLTLGSTDTSGIFNLNDFTLNLTQQNVIILTSVVFIYSTGSSYTYDVSEYGYQIQNSEYDPDYASTYVSLNTNQIILNSQVLNDSDFSLNNISTVNVSYQYKDTGKIIDLTTLSIDTILTSNREDTPSLENIFTLQNAPIVNSSDVIPTLGGVVFIDPNALAGTNTPHPAFMYELQFNLGALPAMIGQYSVNYNTGAVYVFGSDNTQNGTGGYPPLATYSYRYVFKENIDYVIQSDTFDLVALSTGSIIDAAVNINYNYEKVLAQGIDYTADVHIEVLEEFIGNNLVALNTIEAQNFPITDVFRILNQTTGEIYSPITWNNTQINFAYNTAPNITSDTGERASFQEVLNNVLFIHSTTPVNGSTNLIQVHLNDNNIIAATQDCIGSFINTTVSFSEPKIFKQEKYYDNYLAIDVNNSHLQNIGDYQIDYVNGIVWCLVSNTLGTAIGNISYRRGYIQTQNPNIITVNNIYYQLMTTGIKVKQFAYTDFTATTILPSSFDVSNEEFLNSNVAFPYILLNNQIGTFGTGDSFVPGITSLIKQIRGVYEYYDLSNNIQPLNFAPNSTFQNNIITVGTLQYSEYHSVQYSGSNYYITLNQPLYYQSPNITLSISIVRLSDSAQLWNSSGIITLGSQLVLILPGINSPHIGDQVIVVYSYAINNISRVVVDYDRGGYYVDYNYLYDTIVISYEYGDNILDFSQSNVLTPGQTYYTTYNVGALRDALLKNFGTLINIPILNTLDVSFARERYRDALVAAMQSFTAGPTIPSIYNIVNTIVHTPPIITEAAYEYWILGQGLLFPKPIETTGTFCLQPSKYGAGVLIDQPDQIITIPISSNLRLEEGSLEFWATPNWNGIDNKADITISIFKDGYVFSPEDVFIGQAQLSPNYFDDYSFTLNTQDEVLGEPNENKNGVFIYYAPDVCGTFNRWYLDIIDGYSDGYSIKNYQVNITTNGKFYDVKSITYPQPSTTSIRSTTNAISFTISNTSDPMQGITFVADNPHYLFDFGEHDKNRFSIYKDESGYLNFRIIDKYKTTYTVDADVSNWQAGQLHFIGASWLIGSPTGMDEMHLFIDGFEVPNIIKYGSKVAPYLAEKYRTVDPEEIVGMVPNNIVGSTDMKTTAGSNLVLSSLDFNAYGIVDGNILYINENGFDPSGYVINSVDGQTLELAITLPITMTNAVFSINKTTFLVQTEIDLYDNIAVFIISSIANGTDLQTTENSYIVYSPSTNFTTNGILPGNLIYIDDPNFAPTYIIVAVNGNYLTLNDELPTSYSATTYYLYQNNPQEIPGVRALNPSYTLSRNSEYQNQLTLLNDVSAHDIVLIETLGLNNRRIRQTYYVWGSTNNIIMTKLPPPILLGDVKITHILLTNTLIGPSNSTLTGDIFTSNQIPTDQPSLSQNGRTLSVYISGSNINYTTPIQVSINGTINGIPNSTETLTFTANTTQNTINQFSYVNYVQIVCQPNNPNNNCCVVLVQEAYPITIAENSDIVPIIQYSYQMGIGNTLVGNDTNTVSDPNFFFSLADIDNYLIIISPPEAAGQYQIISVSEDHLSMTLSSVVPGNFTDGIYQILNTTTYQTGLQNGFFTIELDGYPGQPYQLVQGGYLFDYYTYLKAPIDHKEYTGFIGSDIDGSNQADAIISQFQTLSTQLTDTRIGETVAINQETITKDYNSLKALSPNDNTLFFCTFNSQPFTNAANTYIIASTSFIQSGSSVNDNFDQSVVFTNTPLIVDNSGILTTAHQGTIEFWVNPLFDATNDPNYRFYFDATSLIRENVVSVNNATVKIEGTTSEVLSVKLAVGAQNIDYFAGGSIDTDGQTLYLRQALPSQNTPVIVSYIPSGDQGNRLSIYKDPYGYVNFGVQANNNEIFVVKAPVYWTKGSWHRVMATFRFNYGIGTDEIQIFIDGYQYSNILAGHGQLFGQSQVFSSSYPGPHNIVSAIPFTDIMNTLYIGSDYTQTNGAFALMDNFRVSDIVRPAFYVYGEQIDQLYSSNTSVVNPVQNDLYTTYIQNFNTISAMPTNYANLYSATTGEFSFSIFVDDALNILADNPISKTVMEELIDILKPGNTTAIIKYDNGTTSIK